MLPRDRTGPAVGTGPAPDTKWALGGEPNIPNAADIADVHPIQLKPENAANVAGYWVTNDLLLRSACWYAQTNRPVLPCQPWNGAYSKADAKAPLTAHGFHDATTDVDLVCQWWTRFPFAMIGSPVPVDELCLDIDPRNEGDRWALVERAGIQELPVTKMVLSGRYDGGHHLFYQRPLGQLTDVRLPKGIDLRVGGKHYTILPPSVHDATGGAYLWRYREHPAAVLPAEVAALLVPATVERVAYTSSKTDIQSDLPNKPTAVRLAGILREVASTPEGNRQTIGFTWAARILKEAGYPAEAWDAVEGAMRAAGASDHDIRTALRERPGRTRVNA
jgi:hypothetical protein